MTIVLKTTIVSIISLSFMNSALSQSSIQYNSGVFKSNPEVITAQISDETISLVIDEIDKSNPKHQSDNCQECPDGKTLVLDIDFTRGFKFPITETDSVYVRVTHLQKNLAENQHNSAQVKNMEASRNKFEEAQLKNKAETITVKSQEIMKLMQNGTLSPEEAQKQLLVLSESYLEDVDNSTFANMKSQEFKEKSNFSIWFYNDQTLTTSEPYSGYFHIKEFNEKRFVAEFRGIDIEECVEKRIASSEEENAKCHSVKSQYLPDIKVFNEGQAQLMINVDIKTFLNNR